MGIAYPGEGIDTFTTPNAPEYTTLSEAGDSSRNHDENHHDLGLAVDALEANASPLAHDHSGGDPSGLGLWDTAKLKQANTHEQADTDASIVGIHHTLGPGPTQAMPGNAAFDYQGPHLYNQALLRCTSTNRPVAPYPGLQIWETDTNCSRVWAAFPGNTYVPNTGTSQSYTYAFDTNNSATALDPAVFTQTYVYGTAGAAGGYMGAPSSGRCAWQRGTNPNATTRCIAKAAGSHATTQGDDQEISIVTSTNTMDMANVPDKKGGGGTSPTNDIYLRMSADGQSYVRFAIGNVGCAILLTTSGYTGEVALGGVNAYTNRPNTKWTAKAFGDTYILYAADHQIIAAADTDGVVNKGEDYRGWAIGMTAAAFTGGEHDTIHQQIPNDLKSVTLVAEPYYTTQFIWQLTTIGASPVFRVEAHTTQEVRVGERHHCFWTHVLEDWFGWLHPTRKILDLNASNTDLVVNEPGHYAIKASLCWDPANTWHDHSMISVEVNGQDIARKAWNFVRGYNYVPGFSQTHDIHIHWYLADGDVVRLVTEHNAARSSWLWWSPDYSGHNAQVVHLELMWLKP